LGDLTDNCRLSALIHRDVLHGHRLLPPVRYRLSASSWAENVRSNLVAALTASSWCSVPEAEQQRTRELTESLERQTATSEVLEVISRSPGNLQLVLEAMLEKAVRICDAKFGNIYRWDGELLHLLAAPQYATCAG
jgi:hypothetical protein